MSINLISRSWQTKLFKTFHASHADCLRFLACLFACVKQLSISSASPSPTHRDQSSQPGLQASKQRKTLQWPRLPPGRRAHRDGRSSQLHCSLATPAHHVTGLSFTRTTDECQADIAILVRARSYLAFFSLFQKTKVTCVCFCSTGLWRSSKGNPYVGTGPGTVGSHCFCHAAGL